MSRIYLDYNATAPIRPEAEAALGAALALGNASAIYQEGREAHAYLEAARHDIAALCGDAGAAVVFTSGGTEACNLAFGLWQAPAGRVARLLVSAVEHVAVLASAQAQNLPVAILPVTTEGVVDLNALADALADPTPALVCVMYANNETGVVQPMREIAKMVKAHGSLLFCDAVQAAGKIPIDMQNLGIDAVALSAHKLGGAMGVGAFVMQQGLSLAPLHRGGGQQLGLRAGTENISGIAAFAAAARATLAATQPETQDLASWRDALETKLRASNLDVVVFGSDAPRLPNTSCIGLRGLAAETLLMKFDLAGIAVSSGAACSSGTVSQSHVLRAMGVDDALSASALRVSLGWQSCASDCDTFADHWLKYASQAQQAA